MMATETNSLLFKDPDTPNKVVARPCGVKANLYVLYVPQIGSITVQYSPDHLIQQRLVHKLACYLFTHISHPVIVMV